MDHPISPAALHKIQSSQQLSGPNPTHLYILAQWARPGRASPLILTASHIVLFALFFMSLQLSQIEDYDSMNNTFEGPCVNLLKKRLLGERY